MVTLPRGFTATRYPGYFWHVEKQRLYSLKVGGALREMCGPIEPNYFNRLHEPAYAISHKGHRRYLSVTYLKSLRIEDSEIPIARW